MNVEVAIEVSYNTPKEVVAGLLQICPEIHSGSLFWCRLPLDSPVLMAIMKYLDESGMTPWKNHFIQKKPMEYQIYFHRKYDANDLAEARYLTIWPFETFEGFPQWTVDGYRMVPTGVAKKVLGIHSPGRPVVLVSDQIRRQIDKEKMAHAAFKPTVITGRGAAKFVEPIWEFTSDLQLPSVIKPCWLEGDNGEPYQEGHELCVYREGNYLRPELHYRTHEIEALEPFDVALPCEWWGRLEYKERVLVVSQRFYQFCKRNKLRMESWVPVRLDP